MKKLLFFSCITLLLAASCKKDNKAVSCRLSQRVSYLDSSQITYDASGRVSVYNNAVGPIFTFTYSGLTAQCVVSYTGSSNTSSYQIYLNSQGLASTITYYVPPTLLSGERLYSYVFLYDNNNRIVRCEQSLDVPGTTSDYFMYDSMVYENGNLNKQFTFARSGASTTYGLQEYSVIGYSTKENKIGYHALSSFDEPTSLERGFTPFFHLYGKGSINLPLETTVYNADGTLSTRLDYSYLFDEKGNLTDEIITEISPSHGPIIDNRKFFYECR